MNIIIPMAGRGTRLRPHTLTIPKPLMPIAGKPIVQRLVEDIAKVCDTSINKIGFIIGRDFGKDVENDLRKIAESVGGEGHIYYQDEKLGTAHAILCAKELLEGNVIVAFADTLFRADFKMDPTKDGIIWVQQVDDPSAFGVIKVNNANVITDFVEKPEHFVSDLAIIGIYYFKDGAFLNKEMQYLIDHDIKDKGEFQLTNALENMKKKGAEFVPGQVSEWLDCGNKDATVYTNKRYLEYLKEDQLISKNVHKKNSVIIPPVFIAENVTLENSVVGPHVSIGENTVVKNSVIQNSIIQTNTEINNANFKNSILGNFVSFEGKSDDLSIGDYNTVQ
ncbi:Glucose-1-phosphate thymidylyltransferase [Fulvivirga imtechensis AK7]|uniref:Glucose-1-phosphate thymidylyltransferase n=1 Tax=Fulvivirga imtechensis AK7 TaxID=1237149 RepID=L8JQX3_9BACT|nr:sugar phosphate nucleotidyltransferase [Fulvivirga imtechensis]ELR69737.1 Glucose-1-phosphate thymidylyltransferase [Fulvivirga imtechensis AK7]